MTKDEKPIHPYPNCGLGYGLLGTKVKDWLIFYFVYFMSLGVINWLIKEWFNYDAVEYIVIIFVTSIFIHLWVYSYFKYEGWHKYLMLGFLSTFIIELFVVTFIKDYPAFRWIRWWLFGIRLWLIIVIYIFQKRKKDGSPRTD